MKITISKLTLESNHTVRQAMSVLDGVGSGFIFVVDEKNVLVGTVTDGDVRRGILGGQSLDAPVREVMKRDFMSLPISSTSSEVNAIFSEEILFVPLVDDSGVLVDYALPNLPRVFPVMEPALDGNELLYVTECVESGWISSQGRFVGQFEKMMSEFHGSRRSLAVCNGTVALHLALDALGIGPGDEVILPDFTFAATINAVLYTGATPVLVDVDSETWTIDVDAIYESINPRTRVIIPVHLYGHPCNMKAICNIAKEKKLLVVEDCAEALGASCFGMPVGCWGDAACFSFFGNKILTTGEGGMVLFKDERVFERAKMLRDHGMAKDKRYWHVDVGYNYRMTNLQAAIGVAQMEKVEEILSKKKALMKMYNELLERFEVDIPPKAAWANPVCWLYTVLIKSKSSSERDGIIRALQKHGVDTRPTFFPLHEMPPYKDFAGEKKFPVSSFLSRTGISLPSSVGLDSGDISTIVKNLKDAVNSQRL